MPPKAKLHKVSGKPKTLPPQIPQNPGTSSEEPNPVGLSPEQAQQFELELCWCIQQLQTGLKSGKLNDKQVQDNTKVLNTLMNNAAPIIKKRQVMRLAFGDYRAKMAAEDKKLKGHSARIKVTKAVPSKKSTFLKKSAFMSSTDNSFRFNFDVPTTEENVVKDISNLNLQGCEDKSGPQKESVEDDNTVAENSVDNFQFVRSKNEFRFNFTCD